MLRVRQEPLKPPDPYILGTVLLLVAVGLLLVFNTSYGRAEDSDIWFLVKKQLVYACAGIAVMFVVSRMRLTSLLKVTMPFLVVAFVLLIAVLVVGTEVNGAKRWIKLGALSVQPSEFAKLALVMYLAGVLAQRKMRVRKLTSDWIAPFCVIGAMLVLILAERDLGTAVVLAAVCLAMFLAAGAMKRHLAFSIAAAAFLAWLMVVVEPYRVQRIRVWLDPWRDPYGEGYQIIHSLIGLGTGGLRGIGLCEGREKFYLPAAPTDFIFSTLAEEAGFIGGVLVLTMFLILIYRGLDVGRRCRSTYGNLAAAGITSLIGIQALTNVAVVSAAIPATGVPLPFISYGGSSMVAMLAAAGVLLAVSRQVDVAVDEREIYENSFDGWRDGRSRVSSGKRRTGTARSRT